jgi:twinkle protein
MGWRKTHMPCLKCDSSDAASASDNGWIKCFSCGANYPDPENPPEDGEFYEETTESPKASLYDVPQIAFSVHKDIESRCLTEETLRKWDYRVGTDENGRKFHLAVYRDSDGRLCGGKLRYPGKRFKTVGVPGRAGLYGRHLWRDNGKSVVITEGELDALSVSQVNDHKWPVVSLIHGAQSAVSDIKKELEWLEGFEKVVLMFDNDEAGQKAVQAAVPLFTPGKVFVAKLPTDVKDASDLLQQGRSSEVRDAFWNASPWRPDEIVGDDSLLEKILEPIPQADLMYPFECFNEMLRGVRKREILTLTAGTGIGKSHLCREMAFKALQDGHRVGYLALEESVGKTGKSILSMYDGVPWIDWNPPEDHIRKLFDKHIRGKFWTYDHWGSQESSTLLSRVNYMAHSLGVDIVFLDHISIVVSGMDGGDERRSLDTLMTKLRALVEKTGIALVLVTHLKKADGTPHEEGGRITLRDLRSSNSIAQLSDIVLALERNQQDPQSKDITNARCLKNRFTGETGLMGQLKYDPTTGRQEEVIGELPGGWEDPDDEDLV